MTLKPRRKDIQKGRTEKMPYWVLRLAVWCAYKLSFWPRPLATLVLWGAYQTVRVFLWAKRLIS